MWYGRGEGGREGGREGKDLLFPVMMTDKMSPEISEIPDMTMTGWFTHTQQGGREGGKEGGHTHTHTHTHVQEDLLLPVMMTATMSP